MWVKEQVQKSSIALDWTARARQEKHALTSALLRVRGRLREEVLCCPTNSTFLLTPRTLTVCP